MANRRRPHPRDDRATINRSTEPPDRRIAGPPSGAKYQSPPPEPRILSAGRTGPLPSTHPRQWPGAAGRQRQCPDSGHSGLDSGQCRPQPPDLANGVIATSVASHQHSQQHELAWSQPSQRHSRTSTRRVADARATPATAARRPALPHDAKPWRGEPDKNGEIYSRFNIYDKLVYAW